MGLDMYLTAKREFYDKELDNNKDAKKIYGDIKKMLPEIYDSGNLNYIEVGFEAGYWRKANAIHKWFIDNCQDGKDDCRKSYVSKEQLKELKELCEQVIKKSKLIEGAVNNGYEIGEGGKKIPILQAGEIIEDNGMALRLLPTERGFFFGSLDYDKGYYEDIQQTIEIIDKCLTLSEEWDFYYHASW